MNLDMNQVSFNVGISSCYDEIMDKIQQINNMQMQFLRKFQKKVNEPSTHASIIYYIRCALARIEEIFADVHMYFVDLQIQFVYDLFRKIYLFSVLGYNYTSEAFLVALNDLTINKKTSEISNNQQKQQKNLQQPLRKKDRFRKIQEMDYQINSLQKEEQKLNNQIREMYNTALLHRGAVQKLKPSMAVRQITDIKECVQTISSQVQNIFQETYQLKYQEFKLYASKFGKPEDIAKQFCLDMQKGVKQKFIEGMLKTITRIKLNAKEEMQKQTNEKEVQTQKLKVEIMSNTKTKPEQVYGKQRKNNEKMQNEIQILKKNQLLTAKQNSLNIQKCKQYQQQLFTIKNNYQSLTKNLYAKNKCIDDTKIVFQREIGQKNRQISKLQKQIQQLKRQSQRPKSKEQFSPSEDNNKIEFQIQTEEILKKPQQQNLSQQKSNQSIKYLKIPEKHHVKIQNIKKRISRKTKQDIFQKFNNLFAQFIANFQINSQCQNSSRQLFSTFVPQVLAEIKNIRDIYVDSINSQVISKDLLNKQFKQIKQQTLKEQKEQVKQQNDPNYQQSQNTLLQIKMLKGHTRKDTRKTTKSLFFLKHPSIDYSKISEKQFQDAFSQTNPPQEVYINEVKRQKIITEKHVQTQQNESKYQIQLQKVNISPNSTTKKISKRSQFLNLKQNKTIFQDQSEDEENKLKKYKKKHRNKNLLFEQIKINTIDNVNSLYKRNNLNLSTNTDGRNQLFYNQIKTQKPLKLLQKISEQFSKTNMSQGMKDSQRSKFLNISKLTCNLNEIVEGEISQMHFRALKSDQNSSNSIRNSIIHPLKKRMQR